MGVWRWSAFLGLVLPLGDLWAQSETDDLVRRAQTIAAATHPSVTAARAGLMAAEAGARIAGARPAAVLSADADQLGGGATKQFRLDVVQDWGVGQARAAERSRAGAARDVAAAGLRLVEARASAQAGRELASWLGWRAIEARLVEEDSLLADVEEALRGRFAVGGARYVDVLRVRSERVRVRSDRAQAAREVARARIVLLSMVPAVDTGAVRYRALLDTLSALRPVPPRIAAPPPDPESLLASVGGLALLDAQVAEAGQRARALRAGRRPGFATSLGVQRYAGDRGAEFGPTVGAAVSLPFTVGATRRALVPAADALVAAAEAERSAALVRLRTALAVARERLAAAVERLGLVEGALLAGAREEREAALGAFRAGDFTLLELLDFERALARVDIERARAAMDAAAALADMYAAAAGDLDPAAFLTGEFDDR